MPKLNGTALLAKKSVDLKTQLTELKQELSQVRAARRIVPRGGAPTGLW